MGRARPLRLGQARLLGLSLILIGCAAPTATTPSSEGPGARTNAERTVVIAVRTEGDTLAAKTLTNVGTDRKSVV